MTVAPSAWWARTVQDFTASPLNSTVQQPHCVVSQPTCVPVNRRSSRRSWTSRRRFSTSRVTFSPLMVRVTDAIAFPVLWKGVGDYGNMGVGLSGQPAWLRYQLRTPLLSYSIVPLFP